MGERPIGPFLTTIGRSASSNSPIFMSTVQLRTRLGDIRKPGVFAATGPAPRVAACTNQIWEKASKYRRLVEQEGVAYVIALFGEFAACVDLGEIQECLSDKDKGLFLLYPALSELLFFGENSGRYFFTYIKEPRRGQEDGLAFRCLLMAAADLDNTASRPTISALREDLSNSALFA